MKVPVPTPRADESESAFTSRCISEVHHKDPGRPHDQIIAMCKTKWRDKGASHERSFQTVVHNLFAGPDGNMATFYLMNVSRNRNKWGVTKQALEEALPTVVGVSLGCGPEYKADKHYPNPMKVGVFEKARMPNGYALGTSSIDDPVVWDKLKTGKWGPISVVITSSWETCSHCGGSLVAESNPFEHDCIKSRDAYIQVHSFKFKRVDLVDVPAYPQAGITAFDGSADGQVAIPIELCASVYESQSIGQAAGSLLDPEVRRKKKLTAEDIRLLTKKVTELEASVTELTDAKTTLEGKVDTLTGEKIALTEKVATLEDPDENPEMKTLKAEIDKMKDERHEEILNACVEARFKAGLAPDKAKEHEALKAFADDMLKFMTLEAVKVEVMNVASDHTGPKAQYTAKGRTDLEAAMESQREAYGFPIREAA